MIATIALAVAVSAAPLCFPVEREVITGSDLAAADPLFAPLSPARVIAHSPVPGRQRIFTVQELRAIADAAGVTVTPAQDLCFVWHTSIVSPEAVEAAMKSSFPEASVEIVEVSQYQAPAGTVVFPKAGLQRAPSAVMFWRGYVSYGEGKKFDIWARAKVTVKANRAIATELLRVGQPIRAEQIQIEPYSGPPLDPAFARSADELVGRVVRTVTLAGSPIKTSNLELPAEINRGDVVNVEVLNGAARISLEARANSTARLGQSVQLQNQTSGKAFRATVSGSGRAVVVLGVSK